MIYTVSPNQTLADVAVMSTGTLENLMAIATANNISPSDDLTAGQQLSVPDGLETDLNTLAYLSKNSTVVATMGYTMSNSGVFTDVFDDTFN